MRQLMTQLLLVLAINCTAYGQAIWPYETVCEDHVGCSAGWFSPEMAINPATGNPAVVMAEVSTPDFEDAIVYYHERISANNWTCEEIMRTDWDHNSPGIHLDLAFDSNGNPGVLLVSTEGQTYLNITAFAAIYAWRASGTWHVSTLETTDIPASFAEIMGSVTFDQNNKACIAYSYYWWNQIPQYGGALRFYAADTSGVGSATTLTPVDGEWPDAIVGASTGPDHTILCSFHTVQDVYGTWYPEPIYCLEVTINPSTMTSTYTYAAVGFTGSKNLSLDGRSSDGSLHFLYRNVPGGYVRYAARNASGTWSSYVELPSWYLVDIAAGGYGPYAIRVAQHGSNDWEDCVSFYSWRYGSAWIQWPESVRDGEYDYDCTNRFPHIAVDNETEMPWILYQNKAFYSLHPARVSAIVRDGDTGEIIPKEDVTLIMYNRLVVSPYTLSSPTYVPDPNIDPNSDISYFRGVPAESPGHHYYIVANADGYEEGYSSLTPFYIGSYGTSFVTLNLYKEGCGRRDGEVQVSGGSFHLVIPALFGALLILCYVPYWRRRQRETGTLDI